VVEDDFFDDLVISERSHIGKKPLGLKRTCRLLTIENDNNNNSKNNNNSNSKEIRESNNNNNNNNKQTSKNTTNK